MKTKKNILSFGFAAALIGSLAFTAPEARAGDDRAAILAGALIGGVLGYIVSESNDHHHVSTYTTVSYPAPVIVHQPAVCRPQPVVVYRPVVVRPKPTCKKVIVVPQKPHHGSGHQPNWGNSKHGKTNQPSWGNSKHGKTNQPSWGNNNHGNGKSSHYSQASAKGHGHGNRWR